MEGENKVDRTKEFLDNHRYLPSDLVTVRTAEIAVRKSNIENQNRVSEAIQCLHILGEAYRGNWNNFDGRELREQLNQITEVLGGRLTIDKFMDKNNIVEDKKHKGIYQWLE